MKSTITLTALTLIVLATVVYGFLDGGSPTAAKNRKFDQTRYSTIQSMQQAVSSYYRKHAVLPTTISEAMTDYSQGLDLTDPETKQEYDYVNIGGSEYKLCATFATDTTTDSYQTMSKTSHPSGHYCYTFTAQSSY